MSLTVSGGTDAGLIEASTVAVTSSGNTTVTGIGPTASGRRDGKLIG